VLKVPDGAGKDPADVVQMRFGTNLAAGIIRQRLDSFRQQWDARVKESDANRLVLTMQTPRSFWQRWTGRQPGLEIQLQVGQPELTAPAGVQVRTEVRMEIRPSGCSPDQSADLLKSVGPLLVESVRQHLRMNTRGRSQERLSWHYPLHVCAILPDGGTGPLIECQGKDISTNGIGFYLPGQLPGSQVLLHLPHTPQTPKTSVPARVVRVQGCGDGWFEVGAVLLPPDELPPDDEPHEQAVASA
jgi:hypothetical protein